MALPANWKRTVVLWVSENWPYLLTAAIAAACLTVLLLAPSTAGSSLKGANGGGTLPAKSPEEAPALPLGYPGCTMKAFVVRVNGKRLCTAGLGPLGVLTAMVSWVGLRPGHDPEGAFTFHVGGLDSRTDEHFEYATPLLRVGDKVSVEIVETDVFDREDKRYVPDFSRREPPAKATVRRQRKGGKRGKDRRST